MQGTGDGDVEQRESPSHGIDTFCQQCPKISEYLIASTIERPVIDHPTLLVYQMAPYRGNVDLFNEIILNRLHTWKRVADEIRRDTLINRVAHFGLNSTAKRLSHLNKLVEEDPEELPIVVESLRRFVDFVIKEHLPAPKIGLNPDGTVHAVWWADDHDGILTMDFLSSGEIRYAAVLQDSGWSVSGASLPDHMMEEIEPFKRILD